MPGQEKQDEQKLRFNRQVNYFIMRYMWQVIRGRSGDETIYTTFNTSRERYTRVINTGAVRYGKGELDFLTQLTGVRKEIFTGEVRFSCLYKENNKQEEITTERWEELFEWRSDQTQKRSDIRIAREIKKAAAKRGETIEVEEEPEEEKQETPQDKIYQSLRMVSQTNKGNWDFYRLCYFLRQRKPAPLGVTADQLRAIRQAIRKLSFSMLDDLELDSLRSLQELVIEKYNLINGIVAYKEAKETAEGKGGDKEKGKGGTGDRMGNSGKKK